MRLFIFFILATTLSTNSFCQYSNIHKVDFYSGNPSKIAWAGALINYIEQKNFSAIKESFGIDSSEIYQEANYVKANYNWPSEVTPGWLRIDDGKDHYVRTYFDKLGDTYTYKYQIEVSFDKADSPTIDFRQNEKVITLDDILNLYYRRIENIEDTKTDIDHPCEKIIIPDEKWLDDAESLRREGKYEESIRLLEKCVWKNPNNQEAYRQIYFNLYYLNRPKEGIAIATKLLSIDSSGGWYYYLRGIMYSKAKQFDLAISDFKQSYYSDYKEKIVDIYLKENKPKEALVFLNSLIGVKVGGFREIGIDYCLNARVYKALGQIDDYRIALDSCISINGKNKSEYRNLASTLFHLGEYKKAVEYHKKSLSVTSINKNTVLLDLAEALITDDQYVESQKITDQLLLAEGLSKKDRFIYLYLNLIAKGLSKSPMSIPMKEFDVIVANSQGIEKGTWNFEPFMVWLKDSKKLNEEEKKFVNSIITKAKTVL